MSSRLTILVTLATALTLGVVPAALAQRFHPSDPLLADDDRLIDVSEEPAEIELSDMYDRFTHIFHISGEPPFPAFVEAQNVNSLDEVPDSSWFTNRHGARPSSISELATASNVDGPPDPDETWTIIAGKSQGITPGFTIIDGQGDRYVIKFDPVGIPELSTAAEVIGTKIFWALGYHVPQNYVVQFHPDNFAIQEGTMVEDTWSDSVRLTEFRVRRMIRRVPKDDAGRMRFLSAQGISDAPNILSEVMESSFGDWAPAPTNGSVVVCDNSNSIRRNSSCEILKIGRRPAVACRHNQRFGSITEYEGFDSYRTLPDDFCSRDVLCRSYGRVAGNRS